jgi:hypothetical protein
MSDKLKKRGWKIRVAAVLVAALVLGYPLSFGPWLWSHKLPSDLRTTSGVAFMPVFVATTIGPDLFVDLYMDYLEWWNPDAKDCIRDIRRVMRSQPDSD